jgi:hypothetical protein
MGVVDEVNTTHKGYGEGHARYCMEYCFIGYPHSLCPARCSTQDVLRAIRARLANPIPQVVALALSVCAGTCPFSSWTWRRSDALVSVCSFWRRVLPIATATLYARR